VYVCGSLEFPQVDAARWHTAHCSAAGRFFNDFRWVRARVRESQSQRVYATISPRQLRHRCVAAASIVSHRNASEFCLVRTSSFRALSNTKQTQNFAACKLGYTLKFLSRYAILIMLLRGSYCFFHAAKSRGDDSEILEDANNASKRLLLVILVTSDEAMSWYLKIENFKQNCHMRVQTCEF
jgi:hypothetical protein